MNTSGPHRNSRSAGRRSPEHLERRRWLATLAVLATILIAPAGTLAAPLGSPDSAYGNDPPFARITPPTGSGFPYDPGGVLALEKGGLLVADGDDLGVTRLTPQTPLNAGGLLDSTFGSGGTAAVRPELIDNSSANAVAVTPSGAYVVAGTAGGRLAVAEFTSAEQGEEGAGALDTSFASEATVPGVFEFNPPVQGQAPASTSGQDLAVEPNGTIVVVGTELIGTPSKPAMMVELIAGDGNSATTFTGLQGDGQPTTAAAVALGPDGTIYVAGTENVGTAKAKAVIARLDVGGFPARLQLDTSFAGSGVLTSTLGGTSAQLAALAVAPDGSAVIGGQVAGGANDGYVARVTASGTLDSSFGAGGVVNLHTSGPQSPMSFVRSIVLEPNGAPVIAGDTGQTDMTGGGLFANPTSFVAQLTSTGAMDTSFNSGVAPPGAIFEPTIVGYESATVTGLAMDEQGRLLLATDASSTSPSTPDEGAVERFFDYAPPTARFTTPSIIAGGSTTLDATTSSDAVGSIVDYAWDLDGSGKYATDGGGSPTLEHTFATPGTVAVSLRVTNAAGQTSTETQQVTVRAPGPAQRPGATPRVLLSTRSLAFSADINDFNFTYIDSNPQVVTVTNAGTGPLSIAGAEIANSAGGFAILNFCLPTLGGEGFATTCKQSQAPADSCSATTLAPGAQCSIYVQYQDGGQYSKATGDLDIDSNAATSPDLVSLTGTATFVPDNPTVGPSHCPGSIKGLGGTLLGCWTDVTSGGSSSPSEETWAAFGPVTIDGQVTLTPTSAGDELFFANGTLFATPSAGPSAARYSVEVSSPKIPGPIAVGTADLGQTPYVCHYTGKGCANPLPIDPDHYTIHDLAITGGEVSFSGGAVLEGGGIGCAGAASVVYAQLPHLFSVAPVPGAEAPTVTFEFGGCTNASEPSGPPGQENNTGQANPVTCPGEATPTPNCNGHTVIPDQPLSARFHKDAAVGARATSPGFAGPRAHAADAPSQSGSGACPGDDVDYSDSVPETFVGAMDFGTPYLCFDPARQIWTAGGTFDILGATVNTGPPPDYGISFNSAGKFVGGGIQNISIGNPGLPLAPPVFLNSFGGSYHTDPTLLTAHATVNVGDVLTITGGAFAVWANPHYPYSYPTGCEGTDCPLPGISQLALDTSGKSALTGFAAGASGNVNLALPVIGSIQLASAYVFYYAPSYFEFAGCLGECDSGLSFLGGAITVNGSIDGQVNTGNGKYNLSGKFGACVNWPVVGSTCLGVKGVVSSEGIGGCVTVTVVGFSGSVNATYPWGGNLSVGFGCELGPVTVAVTANNAVASRVAHVAQANGAVTLKLAGGVPSTSIWVKGAGGVPPGLTLSGPQGQHLSVAGTAKGAYTHNLVIWPEPKLGETLIGILHPSRGPWTITPLPGSAQIAQVSYANALAPPKVATSVSGRGRTRTLSYRIRPREGQQVTFAERSNAVFHILGQASATRGTLRFTPASGPAGHRQIEALISVSGVHEPPIVVGGYTAPGPSRAGRPGRVRLTRSGSTLKIGWGRASGASSYLATVSLSDGRQASFKRPAGTLTLSVPMVSLSTSARVRVMAMTAAGTVGPAAVASVAAIGRPGAVSGLKAAHTRRGVAIAWRRARAAAQYVVSVRVARGPAYAPDFVTAPRFLSLKTLAKLAAGTVATVTVTPLGQTGKPGPARSVRYRAR